MNVAAWSMLLGMGLAATIGQICLTKAFALGDPAKVSIVGLTQVGFGMLFDAAIWGRSFTPLTLSGIALIVAPTAWLLLRRGSEPSEVPAGEKKTPRQTKRNENTETQRHGEEEGGG